MPSRTQTSKHSAVSEEENKEIVRQYRNLLRAFKPSLINSDKKLLRLAFELAMDAHSEMRRKSGEPYILHPIAVAQICVKEMGLGVTAAICALLHDVVEDTEINLAEIEREFGKKIARIVDGLTKVNAVFDLTSTVQVETFRKLLLSLADDVRVILIKIADRLHNMRTMDSMPVHKQLKIASETQFLYAPLAHRLGFYLIKSELEDLSMKYRERERYGEIRGKLNATRRERNRYINEFIRPLRDTLERERIQAKIFGRPKSISSIYNKMRKKDVSFEEVYDIFAIRIVIDNVYKDEKAISWKVYSIVTDFYQPNPDRLRDWISSPKSNGYESLHTTVMGPRGRWVEVQIRTARMDEIAEKGFAAHWKYKEGTQDMALDRWLKDIRDLLKNPTSNALDFLDEFRMNLYTNEIYVFTPKGDLKILRSDATALDFAFSIHTDIGSQCIGAKVNHKLVPISQPLNNGDQVEILTSKKQKPNEDWLNFLVTSRARTATKAALKLEKQNLAEEGKEMLQRKFKQLKIQYIEPNINFLVKFYRQPTARELFYAIANKDIRLSDLKTFEINQGTLSEPVKILPEQRKKMRERIKKISKKDTDLLLFEDFDGTLEYEFAKCCNPIVGDEVFGFITLAGKIKIHRNTCPNAMHLMSQYGYRIVKTRWTRQKEIAIPINLKVTGLDGPGLIQAITTIISSKHNINMKSMRIDATEGLFEGFIRLFIKDTDQLSKLIGELKGVEGIVGVDRLEADASDFPSPKSEDS
jgi:GTP pyrophosphokinase